MSRIPLLLLLAAILVSPARAADAPKRPNILFAIADDWSWPHAGAYGCKFVQTPAFDRVAKEGVLFHNAFVASPGCSPSRAALLTGRPTWQLAEAGTHASSFPKTLAVYPDALEASGYVVGFTGKAWGPGDWKVSGWKRNPAGDAFSTVKLMAPLKGIGANDYAGNFTAFLAKRPKDRPFCFWYGGTEPHRAYEKGAGVKAGKKLADVDVPPFLPDTPEVRSDLLDYAVEVEWFDRHLGLILKKLEEIGELDNTVVVVCSDNGMAFPGAKANCHEYGTHMPLAIRWPARVKGGRAVDDLVNHIDLAPTFLDAAGLKPGAAIVGRSLVPLLTSGKQGRVEPGRERIFTARERHSSARPNNLGYPVRALRTPDFLYVRNFAPNRWPAGDPATLDAEPAFHDIDGSPTKTLFLERRADKDIQRYFDAATAKRPAEELYDVRKDPGNLTNLVDKAEFAEVKKRLSAQLEKHLTDTGDPRMLGKGDVWETYPRYSPIRKFPGDK